LDSNKLARDIAGLMLDKQAIDIVIMDLRNLTSLADYFVIATGTVDVHVKAIIDNVDRSLRSATPSQRPLHIEGYNHLNWVLLDYGDVVVHAFQPESRAFYQLEQLWGDAPIECIEESISSSV
jgi:ribosome-associated protein